MDTAGSSSGDIAGKIFSVTGTKTVISTGTKVLMVTQELPLRMLQAVFLAATYGKVSFDHTEGESCCPVFLSISI